MKTKKQILEEWFKRVWTEEDSAAIFEMFKPINKEDQATGLIKDEGLGPKEFEQFQKLILTLVKDVHISIDSYIEQGDILSAECTFTALSRTSKSEDAVTMKGCVIGKIVDCKIVSASNHFDFINFFESLGLLPENTLGKCLTANAVG